MKFACLFYHDEPAYEAMPAPQREASSSGCHAWVEGLKERGQFVCASGLRSVETATTVRARGGVLTMTDGPFAETKEHLGGITVIEAKDLDEALRLVSTLPMLRTGSIELRPLLEAL
jgi:hypothetical protein